MRPAPTGSMTAASRPRPSDLAASHQRLLATATVQPGVPGRTPVPLLPAKRALALHKLATQRAAQQARLAWQLGQWSFASAWNPRAAAGAVAFASAFWEQWLGLQAQWEDGAAALAEEMGELREANTVSKLVEQELNLVQQAAALATAQAALTLQLLENAQNNLGYWLQRQLDAPR